MGKYFKINDSHIFTGFSDFSIPDLWELDKIGIKEQTNIENENLHDEKTIDFFQKTTIFNSENRFEVKLPWIEGHPVLENNFEIAHKRLLSNTNRLITTERFEDYQKVLLEWEKFGIIEEIKETVDHSSIHYLPHHAVIKESSETTKIRPVFDASCQDTRGISLNSCLEKGPNLIELIPPLIIKFRIGIFGVTADIEKAFLQISVNPDDREFLRFLWWKSFENRELKLYRHCRVVFGVKSSPFLLAATLSLHLDNAPGELKRTAKKLKGSFYVDNCIASLKSKQELDNFIKESQYLLSLANFNIRGWIHNSVHYENSGYTECEEKYVSILGLLWDNRLDTFHCDVGTIDDLNKIPRTKRGLLSIAQKIFDPIGFTSPVMLVSKLLLQETWKMKIDWDDALPEDIVKLFEKWLNELPLISLCRIPRPFHRFDNLEDLENCSIHVFCDASMLAYASCIFLRAEKNGIPSVTLIQAKSRVAPKKITLPRLELLATVIGVRLCKMVKSIDEFKCMETFYWSDSMVALAWIKTKENWNTFVGNRVKEVRFSSMMSEWHHVPGNLNPADIGSRGCNGKIFIEKQWWKGPKWLLLPNDKWPKSEIVCSEKELHEEKRKVVFSNLLTEQGNLSKAFDYFSHYNKIVRLIGWIFRFYFNCKGKNNKNTGDLKSDDFFRAESHLLKIVQVEGFGDDFSSLKNMQVVTDDFGILRLKTRLVLGDDSEEYKFPILLPYKNKVVGKLIEEYHRINCHAGIQTTLILLRERFWIVKGRKFVKEVVSKCIKCKRFSRKAVETPFAPLPKNRIQCNTAFDVTGIDLAGPLYLKGKDKVWVVLFTCSVYRAVHLELVNSLSTDAFLMSLRRFIARRGRISVIYSDNGSNFIGAYNLLKIINWDEVINYSSSKGIKWYFNPPTASWWGGWWERIIRILKELLRRNLGKTLVNYQELETLLCECEAVINSRPLTYLTEDSNDLVPLTPSMFINEQQTSEMPDLDIIDKNHLVKRLRYIQKIRESLRTRFRKEYLAQLVNIGQKKHDTLQVGDIVLIGSDNTKRIDWPLGKIEEIFPGKDNVCRVARVNTKNGELLRPFQRLYPMEICSSSEIQMEKMNNKEEEILPKKQEYFTEKIEGKSEEKIVDKPTYTRSGREVKLPDRFKF